MKVSRPSPSMVIACVALFVALGGTALAATLITSSSQIKNGVVTGADLKNKTIRSADIADSTITKGKLSKGLQSQIGGATPGSFTAREAVRRAGPDGQAAGQRTVATLPGLEPGTYAIFAKTTLAPATTDGGLLGELLRNDRSAFGRCRLNVGGDEDVAQEAIANPGTRQPSTVNLQLTRTIDSAVNAELICESNIPWGAADTSILALKLSGSSRQDVTG